MFDVDTDRTLVAAADLVNTGEGLRSATPGLDQLTTVTQLKEYLSSRDPALRWPPSGADRTQLEKIQHLREKVQQIWSATPIKSDAPIQVLNELLRGVGLKVARGSDGEYRAEPVPASKELADVMTASMATAIQHLVVRDETARMRTCKGEGCDAVIIDLTRNRSRLFCDFGNCANRAHVRAYRARQAAHRKTFSTAPEAAAPVAHSSRHAVAHSDTLDSPRLVKPSAAEKAAQIEVPTSQSARAAKEFRDRMRDELMEKRDKKSAKKLKKEKKKAKT
ncbi:CGNR zinc finger domain-containing protein [Nesterenkonia sp. LB17]|uniref:CGNR zinc finger domain-containing protein n=1 Tax=unclassified Nesterenkonia TaxID=2629769 RepID=UPI001F4D21FC|nr:MULTISPECIES: CGNR zinc finger domain-containing protein [unclassified Nesterenkonia]MCH8560818.1 CGNR zinc finger domain-containing protein [Nesterenkonia sp. DZ6]MCH8563573.1 CGNR zinc finger domain-containing protein [Nesterenkonia sp. YGD6]MCH8566223.1 CGNR zinc finger domain-containing protein [Nesterenkonia sp. LB17]MCH8570898.1 CGNR zinc finger domain-containing protein [Nesterenkonia sp. AY15]